MAALNVGDVAPEFEVPAVIHNVRSVIRLSDYRGKQHVVLAFHVLNWTPV